MERRELPRPSALPAWLAIFSLLAVVCRYAFSAAHPAAPLREAAAAAAVATAPPAPPPTLAGAAAATIPAPALSGPLYAPCLVENWPHVRDQASPLLSAAVAQACRACPAASPVASKLCAIQQLEAEAGAAWRDFLEAVEADTEVHAIIGTRDRAAALHVTLSLWQPPRAEGLHITVLFSASSALQREAYEALAREFPLVTFLERRVQGDYYSMLSAIVGTTSASHILLLADDTQLRLPTNFAQLGALTSLLAVPSEHFAGCGAHANCFGAGSYPRTTITHLGIAQYNEAFKDTRDSPEGWREFMQRTASTFGAGEDHLLEVRLGGAGFSSLQPTMLVANTTACQPYQEKHVLMCYSRPIDGAFTSTLDLLLELVALTGAPTNPGELEAHLTTHNSFPGLGHFEEYTIFFPAQMIFNIQDYHVSLSVRSAETPPLLQELAGAYVAGCRQHPLLAHDFMQWVASEEQGCTCPAYLPSPICPPFFFLLSHTHTHSSSAHCAALFSVLQGTVGAFPSRGPALRTWRLLPRNAHSLRTGTFRQVSMSNAEPGKAANLFLFYLLLRALTPLGGSGAGVRASVGLAALAGK